jgi:hypothetical protein
MAADIQEAIDDVTDDMASQATTLANFNARFAIWFNDMFVEGSFLAPGDFWDPLNAGNRTIYNWAVPTKFDQQRFIDAEASNFDGQEFVVLSAGIRVVLAVLTGVQQATIRTDITADQETSVVNAYNAAWT